MNYTKIVLLTNLFLFLIISTFSNAQEIGGPYTADENTVLLMHFDGNLTNNSTLSSDGVPTGSGMTYSSNSQTNLGQSLNFNGSSYITVPHNTNLNLSGDWTIELWFRPTEYNNILQYFVQKPGDTDSYLANYALQINPYWDNVLYGFYFNAADRIGVLDIKPNLNQWYHICYFRDVTNSLIEIVLRNENLEIVSTHSYTFSGTDVLLSSQDLRIGEGFIGDIDELRISNVVRTFTPPPPPPFPEDLDQARIEKKMHALNLHRMKYDNSPYALTIDLLSSAEYDTQKPSDALPFDCGYVNEDGWVYVSEPTTTEQLAVFSDIDQAAIYYMCQSFLQYYYEATEMPIWFKTGFAAYESDMRFDDADIKTAYNNYGGTLTSFDVLNNPTTFATNNGLAISYLFGEFIGVFKTWGYHMVKEVNASTIIPESDWYNAGTIEDLFTYFMTRYFSARILETNEQERLKFGMETEHFKHYYREAEDYWLAYFPDILEEAITEYIGLLDFETYEKFSSLTMPICNYVTIGGGECVNLRYTSGTAWSSGIWASSPDTDNADDIKSFIHLIRHELAHLVQAQLGATNTIMTAWLNEGFAEFMSRGPSTPEEKIALKSLTEKTLNDAIEYFGHLPTFEDTKVYPGQTTVDYYLLGQIMQNFIYETRGYSAVREVIINPESGIENMGFSSTEAFMAAYYHYLNVEYLQIEEPDYFTNYDTFITKLTNLTSSADSLSKLNTFWDNLIATGNFPFAIDTKVAFLYRDSADKINWAGEFNNWDMNSDAGNRIGVSDIWLLEKEFPADARSGYKIIKNGSEWLADPHNPYPLTGEFGNSELRMPEYVIPPETIPRTGIPKGTLTDNILKFSTSLNYTSQYRVYTPAGYSTLSNLPTIYVADGQDYLDDSMGKMVVVLDNLIADEIIEPVIAVFLDPRDPDNLSNNRRGPEYRNNINFVNYVTQALIPDIDATYKTNSEADARGMMGASWGGYNAAYFCVKANDYFHMIGMNSAYLHPEGDYSIDTDLQAANLDGMKLYLSYGTFDVQGEQYFYRLKNIFDQKGKDYEYNIIGDGHTWENWSRVVGKALEYFYSETAIASPVVSGVANQTINKGDSFSAIQLDDFVTDTDNSDSELTWSYSGNSELVVTISNRIATVATPNSEWSGSEKITFIATDPDENSGSDEVVFTVLNNTSLESTLSNNIIITSSSLGYACQYRVYTPANYLSLSDLPTIYVTDGQDYLSNSIGKMVTTLDNLIANEIIKPVIAVFLDPRDPNNLSYNRRGFEYRNNMNFVNYITQELIPVIDASYKTNASADARGIMGASYGGYNAEYFSVKASDYFNSFGMNSPYLHPNDNYNIDAELQAANLEGLKIYLSTGSSDADGVRYFNRLKGIFDSKGIEFESDLVSGGHDWGTWNKLVDKALYYFFPNSSNGNPPFVTDIPNQLIFEGKLFQVVKLDDFVSDSDNADSEITWTYSGNDKLSVEIDGNRNATITPIDIDWSGNETITFKATDPSGNTNSDDVKFIIVPVNDYPIISEAPELIEFVSDTSTTLDIWGLVSDVETSNDSLLYEFSIDSDSIFFSYDDGAGILTLSAELEFGGEGDLIWSVNDSEATTVDTIHIAVEKVAIIGVNDEMIIPEEYVLHQNYPNPFNPSTMVKYGLPEQSNIKIEVFNMLGQSVGLLVNSEKSAGYYETTWDASNLPSGIYLISIRAEGSISKKNFSQSRKALLIK